MKITLLNVFLDYDYIKNHYRLISAALGRQKELDVDPKAIQQIEKVQTVKLLLMNPIFENIKKTRLEFSQWSVTVL